MQSLNLYVRDKRDEKVYVTLHPATPSDIEATKSDWQTYWGTEYLEDPKFLKYAAKTDALAEYYEKQIRALPLPSFGGPRRYMLADEAALGLLSEYI